MPEEWALAAAKADASEARRARIVCDFIAGMTDRYALAEHRRQFGEAPNLRLGEPEPATKSLPLDRNSVIS